MAVIDNEGVKEVLKNIKNPLNAIYDKLEASGQFGNYIDEFDYIYKFLDKVENDWVRPGSVEKLNVVINGKTYTTQGE